MAFNDAWGHDGKTYSGQEMRQLVAALTDQQVGVVGDPLTALKITQQTVAAATVKAAAGGAIITASGAGLGGSYQVWNDADLTSPTIAPTGADGRKDRVIVRVTAGVPALEVVQGTASGSPAEPSITGDNYLELALITLPGSTTNITDAMITDRRVYATLKPGYAQVTANQTGIGTGGADLAGLSATVSVAAGRRLKITGHVRSWSLSAADNRIAFRIQEGATVLGESILRLSVASESEEGGPVVAVVTPSAGSHTYKLTAAVVDTGTAIMDAGATYPAFILVEDIGPA